ncbi:MAG TPA: serine/threonine-protein kinase [Kofleriaceae bacterium]|nr:serine/threonine-protein kinase [Kofleriaceae bacterium]
MIGTTIGGYQITDRLAEGGMGAVFVAKHAVMGRDAVVKLLLPELSHNEDMVRRFFNEAKAAAAINDPGIVQVFDVGYLPDRRAYIVMERLRGETLASRLRTRGMRIDQAVHVLRLLARTLDAAHEHGIVHRDLKPDNIFLVPDKDVIGGERTKILDFGIAKLANAGTRAATQAGSIFGTPAYMAPEQCSDSAAVDARADLYAIGCIAYEMLCGQPPFGMGGIELLAAHLRDEPVPLRQRNADVPPWLEQVVHRLLRKHPNERYQTAAELHGALDPTRQSAGTAPTITPQPFPVVSAAPTQPPPPSAAAAPALTTHTAAAGAVSTAPPPPRGGAARWVAGAIGAVVIGVVVVIVAAGGGKSHDEPTPVQPAAAPTPAPAPVPAPVDYAKVFDGIQRLLASGDFQTARAEAEQIPASSPFHEQAIGAIADAERAAKAAPPAHPAVAVAPKHDPKHASAPPKPPTEKSAEKTPVPAAPPVNYDEELRLAEDSAKARNWPACFTHAEAALRARPGDKDAAMWATKAACVAGNAALARHLAPKDVAARDDAQHTCDGFGIQLD